jgi:hypothetical protein
VIAAMAFWVPVWVLPLTLWAQESAPQATGETELPPPVQGEPETFKPTGPQPTFGFLEIMYGFFPVPRLAPTSSFSYTDAFKPGFGNLSSGPSALLMGVHYHGFRFRFFELGPFLRGGIGIEEGGKAFFVAGGRAQTSSADSLTLLLVPIQTGVGVTFHMLDRLISLSTRAGVQWNVLNQSFQRGKSGRWVGNFSYLMELNLKLNLNWLEPFSAHGLFFSWGIQNTYLSFHVFYLGRLTGQSFVFDSSQVAKSIQKNLGWFLGFTFEI